MTACDEKEKHMYISTLNTLCVIAESISYPLQGRNACNNRYQTMSTQKHQSLLLAADRTENVIQLLQAFTLSLSLLSFQTCGKILGKGYSF